MNNLNELKEMCQKELEECNSCNGDPEYDCVDCTQGGKAIFAHKVLEWLEAESEEE